MIELNDLLQRSGIDPATTLVLRHTPTEKGLRSVLPALAAERPEVFNTYQSQQDPRTEAMLARARHLASFIGHETGKAIYVGLYEVAGHRPASDVEFWADPAAAQLRELGLGGPKPGSSFRWFDLKRTAALEQWAGKLVVEWPGSSRAWQRWSGQNRIPVHAIREESGLVGPMPHWSELVQTWAQLKVLPRSWQSVLSQSRGVYYIFDTEIQQGYVGAAYGQENILGRWRDYARRGDGGNRYLRDRSPENFRFSILELVAPSADPETVQTLEASWKRRLSTLYPLGLNGN